VWAARQSRAAARSQASLGTRLSGFSHSRLRLGPPDVRAMPRVGVCEQSLASKPFQADAWERIRHFASRTANGSEYDRSRDGADGEWLTVRGAAVRPA